MFREKLVVLKLKIKKACDTLFFQFRELTTIFKRRKGKQRGSAFLFQYRSFASGFQYLLGSFPALLALGFIVFVTLKIFGSEETIKGRYRSGMTAALASADYKLARAHGERLILWSDTATTGDRMDWATCLLKNNERNLAFEQLNQLAPNDRPGHPPAHRIKAVLLTERFQAVGQKNLLEPLFFHLKHANDQGSYPVCLGFSTYFAAIGQIEKAIPYLKSAAAINPMVYSKLAAVYAAANDQAAYNATLEKAATELSKALETNPEKLSERIEYAKILELLNRQDEALTVLIEGHELEPSPRLNRAIAVLYMKLFDRSSDSEFRMDLVQAALEFDPGYSQPYAEMVLKFKQLDSDDPQLREQIFSAVKTQANQQDAPAIALFSLSNLAYLTGDQNQYRINLEQTLQKDPQFSIAANNLALLLASDKEHLDIERAVTLAKGLVQKYPNKPKFHETYGTILMRLGEFELALKELEKVINQVSDKASLHSKLAKIYEHINKPDLADMHREKSIEYTMKKVK